VTVPSDHHPRRRRAQTWAFTAAFLVLLAANSYAAWLAHESAIDSAAPGEDPDYTVSWVIAIGGGLAIVGLFVLLVVTLSYQRRLRMATDELAESEARGEALQAVTGRLARALTSEDVVAALLDHLPASVGAKSAAVAITSDTGPVVLLTHDRGGEELLVEPGPVIAAVLSDGQAAWLPSPLGWRNDAAGDQLAAGGWALAVLPLQADDVRGLLAVSYARVHTFVDEERALLETIGVMATSAFARGRRYDAEHRASAALQRTALPAGLPDIPQLTIAARYRAGAARASVGGDWYDVIDLHEDRVALLVGDVVGHGMDAAVAMGRLRTGFRIVAPMRPEPSAMVRAVSEQVEAIPNAMCSTVICAIVHLPTGVMDWCRAGHLPPLLVRDGAAQLLDEAGVPPLGVAPELRPPVHRLVLAPGDVVLLYTDGVIERRHETIDDGFERLRLVAEDLSDLAPEELSDALLEALVPVEEQTDDVAILVVRFDGPMEAPSQG
jgi:serine phosphatase RsbU (regulator of sigma subunit)